MPAWQFSRGAKMRQATVLIYLTARTCLSAPPYFPHLPRSQRKNSSLSDNNITWRTHLTIQYSPAWCILRRNVRSRIAQKASVIDMRNAVRIEPAWQKKIFATQLLQYHNKRLDHVCEKFSSIKIIIRLKTKPRFSVLRAFASCGHVDGETTF